MAKRSFRAALASGLLALLAACGGGGDGGDGASAPAAVDPGSAPLVGSAGGSATHASGASVIVPAGALATETTIRIAMDSTGAAPWSSALSFAGDIYSVTPHGARFNAPVEVRLPIMPALRSAEGTLMVAKAESGEPGWTLLAGAVREGDAMVVKVDGFSYFRVVVIPRLPTIAPFNVQAEVVSCTSGTLNGAIGCIADAATTLALRVRSSGDALAGCIVGGPVRLSVIAYPTHFSGSALSPAAPAKIVLLDKQELTDPATTGPRPLPPRTFNLSTTLIPWFGYEGVLVQTTTECLISEPSPFANGAPSIVPMTQQWQPVIVGFRSSASQSAPIFANGRQYNPIAWVQQPDAPTGVEGQPLQLTGVLSGGASLGNLIDANGNALPPRPAFQNDSATVDWERSDDGGLSWRPVARSWEHEADPDPFHAGRPWRYWASGAGLPAVTRLDAAALFRGRACYTIPGQAPTCSNSDSKRLTIAAAGGLPTFAAQASSQLIRQGQTASFTVVATGLPAPALQWRVLAPGATAYVDVPGATAATFTTAPATLEQNGSRYVVVADNGLGSATSAPVTLSVSPFDVAPTVVTQPASLAVGSGSDAAFAIIARGTEALSYQWQKDGAPVAGANSPVLRLAAVVAANAGNYTVTVTNAAGSATSNPAALTVGAASAGVVAPTIVTQPVSVLINAGNTATFAVGVSGSSPIAYQWTRDGQPIPGATAAFYSIAQATIGDAATYRVRVSNGVGTAVLSDNVILTVNASAQAAQVAITTQPSPQVQAPGGSATFAVAATGSGPIGYQWLKNGAPIAGATGAVLTLASVAGSDAASYAVTVGNALNTATSNAAGLVVLGAPAITGQPATTSATEGATTTFGVAASGSALRYQWTRDGVAIAGATTASYTTPALALADSGAAFAVVVYNGAGVAFSSPAVLTVTPAAAVTAATLVSVSSAGVVSNNRSTTPSISADGRVIAFVSSGTNLVPGIAVPPSENGHAYVRNLATGVTTLVNQTPAGTPSSRGVVEMKLAANGRHVVFTSFADDLVAGDTNDSLDVFVRDLQTGTTTRVNVLPGGAQMPATGNASLQINPTVSADGAFVAFAYPYDLLGTGAPMAINGIYLRDMAAHSTRLAVASTTYAVGFPVLADDASRLVYLYGIGSSHVIGSYDVSSGANAALFTVDTSIFPEGIGSGLSLSANGRFVAFTIRSATWVPGAASAFSQVAVVDHLNPGELTIASTGASGIGNGHSAYPVISGDGRYVLFQTQSPSLTGDPAATVRIYVMVRDRVAGTTAVASRRANGTPVWAGAGEHGMHALSANGTVLAWVSDRFDMTGESGDHQVYAAPRP